MKELLLMIVCVLLCHLLMAQTFDEWFEQNDTQLPYLQEQIAALTVYTGTEESGYLEIGNGLDTIDEVEQGDYIQHSAHFAALSRASPGVLADPRIAEIRQYLVAMTDIAKAIVAMAPLEPKGAIEWEAVAKSNLDDAQFSIDVYTDELMGLLAPDTLKMDDAERKQAIAKIHRNVLRTYGYQVRKFEIYTANIKLPQP